MNGIRYLQRLVVRVESREHLDGARVDLLARLLDLNKNSIQYQINQTPFSECPPHPSNSDCRLDSTDEP